MCVNGNAKDYRTPDEGCRTGDPVIDCVGLGEEMRSGCPIARGTSEQQGQGEMQTHLER